MKGIHFPNSDRVWTWTGGLAFGPHYKLMWTNSAHQKGTAYILARSLEVATNRLLTQLDMMETGLVEIRTLSGNVVYPKPTSPNHLSNELTA